MKYSPDQIEKAKTEGLPLVKIEIDYRYVADRKSKKRQCWGAATHEVAATLGEIITEHM
jgi:hypothetical protein